jgi:acylpyruvate hydrolase
MKLVTFSYRQETRVGALVSRASQEFVLDLNRMQPSLPADMITFLRDGEAAMRLATSAVSSARAGDLLPLSEVTLLAPVPRPGKIICLGHNYEDHTGGIARPEYPTFFAKFSNVVIGPHEPIVTTRTSEKVDYEGELAVVIGQRCKYVDQTHALDVVAGYTIFNDMSARDFQKRSTQWTLGKSFDTFGPMGPALVTRDEIPDPGNLELVLTVNGEERQHSNTCHLIFPIAFLIASLTEAMTLEPGDLISTGTPSGTGGSKKPPIYLKAGDEVRVRIDRIGELVNPVAAE